MFLLSPPTARNDDLAHDLRFRRDVELLHRLGPRPLYELLAELGRERLVRSDIEAKVARYARLEPEIVRALGADQFPPRPLRLVR